MRAPRVWPFRVLARVPEGMSPAEAQLAGLAPPPGWTPPPRAGLGDAVRTTAAVARLVGPIAAALLGTRRGALPSTTTDAGLAAIRDTCLATLARLGVTLEVRHAERVPRAGGLVLMWNQTSHLDHLVLPAAIPRPFHSLYNNEIRATPLYGRYMADSGHLWVDRTDEPQWRAQVAAAAARVGEGACVLVSPEGTRSWDGRLLPMKRGAFILARESGRPVVCVTVIGARDRLPRGSAAVRPGPVRIVFSEPIASVAGADLERAVTGTFERLLAEPEGGRS